MYFSQTSPGEVENLILDQTWHKLSPSGFLLQSWLIHGFILANDLRWKNPIWTRIHPRRNQEYN